MLLHVANYLEADRRTARAGEDLLLGAVIKITQAGAAGNTERRALHAGAGADIVNGKYGVAFKVSSDPLQVTSTTVPTAFLGDRTVSIKSGDLIVECRVGSILEYDPSLLHSSITASNVTVGEALAFLNATGQLCKDGTASSTNSPVCARVYDVVNGKIRIEVVSA